MVDEQRFTQEATAVMPTLYRISHSILRAQADAQDAVQQGLLKAWAARDRARLDTLRAFMTRIVINECHNIQRHRMRVVPASEMAAHTQFVPPDIDVAHAVAALPESKRIPLLLKYAGQYTEQEIAMAMGLPLTTVKSRLHSARAILRKQLADREVVFE